MTPFTGVPLELCLAIGAEFYAGGSTWTSGELYTPAICNACVTLPIST